MSKSVLTSMELAAAIDGHDPNDIRQAVNASPNDATARYRHGCLLAIEGQWMQALDELLESVKIDKSSRRRCGAQDLARASLRCSGKISPSWPSTASASGGCCSSESMILGPSRKRSSGPSDSR